MKNMALIGAGNLANSLLQGLSRLPNLPQLYVFDISPAQMERAARACPAITLCSQAAAAVAAAEVVLLCVKPTVMRSVCTEIRCTLDKHLLISVAAGVNVEAIQAWTSSVAVVRCMPNLPVAVGQGMSVLHAGAGVLPAQCVAAEEIFRTVGEVAWVAEEMFLDTATALSGSGPAYFFYFLEALQDAAISLGMTPGLAKRLTVQTALGAAIYARESTASLSELCARVSSRGGTTAQSLAVFERENLPEILKRAVQAAARRCGQIRDAINDA